MKKRISVDDLRISFVPLIPRLEVVWVSGVSKETSKRVNSQGEFAFPIKYITLMTPVITNLELGRTYNFYNDMTPFRLKKIKLNSFIT